MAALETTLFVSAKQVKIANINGMITYGCLNISPLLVDYGCLINISSISQTYDRNILIKANFLHGEGNCTTIFSFSKRCKHNCNYYNVVISLINPCSSVKYSLSHHFLSGEKVQVFYRMPTNIKFNLQISRHYFN